MPLVNHSDQAVDPLEVEFIDQLCDETISHFTAALLKHCWEFDKANVVVRMTDLQDESVLSRLTNCKFDWQQCRGLGRIAIVGGEVSREAIAALCRSATNSAIECFEPDELAIARVWAAAS